MCLQLYASAFGAVGYREAKDMVVRHHYSGCMPKGRNMCWGVRIDGQLYAVAVYGNGINCHQAGFLSRVTGLPVTNRNHCELKRLVRTEPRHPEYQLTQLLAAAHRELGGLGYRFVVAFSDPDQGHDGTIYRAANFAHLGHTQAEWHDVDKRGERVHRRRAYRHSRRHGCSIAESRAALGLSRTKTAPRDRWFLAWQRRDRGVMRSLRGGA